jgi:hypothetical protein
VCTSRSGNGLPLLLGMGRRQATSAPSIPAGLSPLEAFADPTVIAWAVCPMLAFLLLFALLSVAPTKAQKMPAFVARNLVCVGAFAYAAYAGVTQWYSPESAAQKLIGYESTLFAFTSPGFELSKFMLGFQCFDIVVSGSAASLRKAEHLSHHILSAGCALCTLSGPLFGYYAVYYFGAVEISSVPLVFVDIYRTVPELVEGSRFHHALNEASRTVFAVSFIGFRVFYWPYVTSFLLSDILTASAADDFRGFKFQVGGEACAYASRGKRTDRGRTSSERERRRARGVQRQRCASGGSSREIGQALARHVVPPCSLRPPTWHCAPPRRRGRQMRRPNGHRRAGASTSVRA